MIDATRILDLLVGGQQGGSVVPQQPVGQPVAQPQSGAGANDLVERARGILGNVTGAIPGGFGGGVAGGVAAGAITSLLLGSKAGRELAGDALKLGAAAALGGLAYRAYNNYRAGLAVGGAVPAGASVPPVAAAPAVPRAAINEHALVLVRAMIAAAMSDGVLDATEREAIVGRLAALGITSEEQSFLEAEIARPWSPAQFAASTPVPEQRAEIYLASSLAIDADTDAERAYLNYLAATLGLDAQLVAHLEEAVRQAKAGAVPTLTV
ncbi:tellurite resistance TerB family protein [Hyphomicrobium sp. D-2]|uniref:tellurite resistance TerB family protein n=1 Tax=Hyphomicrobium sp. D-2 TaxID=3041621 RepID=UPI002455BAAD|nr:tellurite resistance TerB family protein [Hyphomicrobium sp. D-2]MDH4981063.1 tellurite resistance TerB family protein [Hyphomicrobium sp. D-2]